MPDQQLLVEKILRNYSNQNHSNWHEDTERLKQFPPEEEAAKCVIAALERRAIDTWPAAYLLRCVRHPIGYPKLMEVLLGNHSDTLAELHVGLALAAIDPAAAYRDLLQLLNTHKSAKTRGVISHGLSATGFPQAWDDLLDLTLRKRLSPTEGSGVLSECSAQRLAALLDSEDALQQELGLRIADHQSTRNVLNPELLPRVRRLLENLCLEIPSKIRVRLEKRLAKEN